MCAQMSTHMSIHMSTHTWFVTYPTAAHAPIVMRLKLQATRNDAKTRSTYI